MLSIKLVDVLLTLCNGGILNQVVHFGALSLTQLPFLN